MSATVFYTIRDADGDISTISFSVEEIGLLTNELAYAATIENGWDIINALVNGQLVNAGFTVQVAIGAWTNIAAAVIGDVQEKAEFIFDAVGGFVKRISLPTFIETFFTNSGGGKEVDVTQSEVTAFNTMITAGLPNGVALGNPIKVQTDHGEDVTAFVRGGQSWGKNRR